MITQIRTATIHDGKVEEAFAAAVKVASYVTETFGVELSVARNVGGSAYEVHWLIATDSLATWEKLWSRIEADDGYRAILAEIREAGLFIGASVNDRIIQRVS